MAAGVIQVVDSGAGAHTWALLVTQAGHSEVVVELVQILPTRIYFLT